MAAVRSLQVRLLGRPSVSLENGEWREFPAGLRAAAMGYLAFARRWVGRDELVALFWPDRPEATARGNLRPLLAKLAREPLAVGLEREPTRVRWLVESDHEALMAAQRERRWNDAWRLARGELLEGVVVAHAPEFESWLDVERAGVRDVVRSAGLRVADAALEAGALDDAGEALTLLQRLDPLDEAVLRRSMVVLARSGARGDALAAYQAFVERCRDELDAAPEAVTADLAEAVRSGREGAVPARKPQPAAIAPRRLPTPLTPLVGRGSEVAEVVARLTDADCRLVTLVGSGGVGKTRLALEAARLAAPHFRGGVCAVDLAPVSSESGLASAFADALGAQLDAHGDVRADVVRAVASHEALVLLDNVEHLAAAPGFVRDLLSAAPGVRVLATSRVALELAAEWRWDVAGLPYRSDARRDVAVPGATMGDHDHGVAAPPSEAAALLLAAGRRASRRFAPGQADLAVIESIVARLEGLPLAIELAAAWLRVLDVREIDAALEAGFDLLEDQAPDRPERHTSMRRVLDGSWSLLQPRERTAMRHLAVFRGGFDLAAARAVVGLEGPTLLALVNKSFVRRGEDGRFTRHPLVWRYARERALEHESDHETVQESHARYYLNLLAERRLAIGRPDLGRVMHELQVELENVVIAWRWALERGRDDLLLTAAGGLAVSWWARGWYESIDTLLCEALAVAAPDGALRGVLLAASGFTDLWKGRGDHGLAKLQEGTRLVEGRVDPADRGWVHLAAADALKRHGRDDAATAAYDVAATAFRESGLVHAELIVANNRIQASTVSDALGRLRELAHRATAAGATRILFTVTGGIASLERLLGDFARAERSTRRRRDHAGDTERDSMPVLLGRHALSVTCLERGRLMRAEAIACATLQRRAFAAARERFGDGVTLATALVGRVALVRRDVASAEAWTRRALEHHQRMHGREAAFDLAVETLARAALASGDATAAGEWLEAVGRGPEPAWFSGRFVALAHHVACECCRAEVALARGEFESARATMLDALASATRAELITATLGALLTAARIVRAGDDEERATALLRYVSEHPRATFETRSAAAFELAGTAERLEDACDDGVEGVLAFAAEVAAGLAEPG